MGRWVAALPCIAAIVACSASPTPAPTTMLRPAWQETTLPVPSGERAVVRGSASCGGTWYLSGSMVTAAGAYRPAIWTSTDLRTWRTIPINPVSFYGKQNTISFIGCRGGLVAGIGWQIGGAHGFPRYSGWFPDATGT